MVVLPTYNEVENLEPFLRRVRASVPDACVLVVDDASPDGTGALADRLADELGHVDVVHRAGKAGLGSAYRDGFTRALERGADVLVSMDADLSHDPAVLPDLLSAIRAPSVDGRPVDMVIGSRYVPGGDVVDWPAHRRLLSRWGNRYTAWVLGLPVRDCTSGYRAYRAEAVRAIDHAATTAEGYAFLTELVRRMADADRVISEVPITFVDRRRGSSKMSGRIVAESMLLVTRWGVVDRWRRGYRGRS
ncbi:MAG: polyprenol monophosphomannose synthase [Ilumatobacteraceae bacterium]